MNTINFNALDFEREVFLTLEGAMIDDCTNNATIKVVDFNNINEVLSSLENVLEEFKTSNVEVVDGWELIDNELYYSIQQWDI